MAARVPTIWKRVIPIRYTTPSRRRIVIIVAQTQDPLGNWMVPTIVTSEALPLILESGRFADDIGDAFTTAAYFWKERMLKVKRMDAESNELNDLSIGDG